MSTDRMINRFQKDEFYRIVGSAIQAAREAEGWTITEMADEAKLTKSTIQNAELGASCSLLVVARIAEALDTTLDALVPLEALR